MYKIEGLSGGAQMFDLRELTAEIEGNYVEKAHKSKIKISVGEFSGVGVRDKQNQNK